MIETRPRTIGEIAAANPATVKVFQQFDIDFCCGGKRPLDEVCAEKKIPFDLIQSALDNAVSPDAAPEREWSRATLAELTAHLVATHHAYLQEELPRLEGLMTRVVENHAERHGDSLRPLQETFLALKAELDAHLRKEEMILFPYITELEANAKTGTPAPHSCFGSIENPIRVMELEHENAGEALRRMRALTDNYALPDDACNGYKALFHGLTALEADLHIHIHKENNILHPRARKL